MTKVDIISGFLGAGKTTFIKKLINDVYQGQQIVLIENEFGEIGIDGTFMNNAGIEVTEINSGCICCSLVGDFEASLKEVLETYHPDRIIIEPSGVGKLSDVIKAVGDVNSDELELDNYIAVIDAKKCRLYTKNFGEFFNNQIEYASLIILSRTQDVTEYQLDECIKIIKDHNDKANIITTPWDQLTKETLVNAFSDSDNLRDELLAELDVCPECGHHHEHIITIMTVAVTIMNIITIMTVAANIMNIITIMTVAVTIMNIITIMTVAANIMNIIMTMTATANIMNIITTMTVIANTMNIITIMIVAVDITTTIIMLMKYLQAGVNKHLKNILKNS